MKQLKRAIKSLVGKSPFFVWVKLGMAWLGYTTYPLPFSHTSNAEPYLKRAIARIGIMPGKDDDDLSFYSYLSEIWPDGYEQNMLMQYMAYLPSMPKGSQLPFLDIGCGAGEFVKFLDRHGIAARGIDNNLTEVLRAQGRGLDVQHADAMSYLEDNQQCFSGVSLLEVIEHISPDSHKKLLRSIFNSLAPNGVVLIETINTKSSLSFNTFYGDPTHTRPIPSEYLVFLAQWVGFNDVRIVYTGPMAFSHSQALDPSLAYTTYAIVANKPDTLRYS